MAIPGVDLKEFRQTCRIRVRIYGEEKITRLTIRENGNNTAPVGEIIFLEPGGWYNTDDVDLLEILPWEE